MGAGMADYAAKAHESGKLGLETIEDLDLYCHYVAGIVGEGVSRIFSASGKEREFIGEQLVLSNDMGLLLQRPTCSVISARTSTRVAYSGRARFGALCQRPPATRRKRPFPARGLQVFLSQQRCTSQKSTARVVGVECIYSRCTPPCRTCPRLPLLTPEPDRLQFQLHSSDDGHGDTCTVFYESHRFRTECEDTKGRGCECMFARSSRTQWHSEHFINSLLCAPRIPEKLLSCSDTTRG